MKNIILDLDNTIICAVEYNIYNKNKFQSIDNALTSKNMDTSYKVYQRPHLETFLDFIFNIPHNIYTPIKNVILFNPRMKSFTGNTQFH